ncbi:hypothetical protein CEUSTIGMA_g2045.t1 [Chlamydomonas eustigma]|uniref:Uncharacterized protein n=1 Tax=Chlamydomonas eustigma TaxID=1157962 RepID=A0A250WUU3_9CHLO|nr:hypothetical protein CEUSTIGMA_g2045.t1 [Chlamydomonas eustigma]|eukprot:GAX74597.1 hypothetical protein CEUSTIGMA_g2045.t1 [Chlamydomonas eustigma]
MGPSFKYVIIPASSFDAIQELSLEIPEGQEVECFLNKVKKHFSVTGGERSESQKENQKQLLIKQLGEAASNVDPTMLETAVNMQMVENISLLPNSAETSYVGVNMYCDDQAQMKGLELNNRASQLAQCCGKLIEVRGDAFLARVFDNEDDFKRMDLTIQEVSSSAAWVMKAHEMARRKEQSGGGYQAQKDFLDRLNKKKLRTDKGGNPPLTTEVRELSPAEIEKEEGNAAFKRGDWKAAIERYTSALTLDPKLIPALNNRALAALKLGMAKEAEIDCNLVLECEPLNVKALLRRATAREQQANSNTKHKYQEALDDVIEALRIEPLNKEAAVQKSRLLQLFEQERSVPEQKI